MQSQRTTWWGLALAIVLALGACNQIFGVSELPVAETDGGARDADHPKQDATVAQDGQSGEGGEESAADGGADVWRTRDAKAADAAIDAGGTHDGKGADATPDAREPHDTGTDSGVPSSCALGGPGMTTCPAGTGTESCCTSLEVEGGTFYRRYENGGDDPYGEDAAAAVNGFRLDKYLVTVGRFRQFVHAWNGGNGYQPEVGTGKHSYLNDGNGLVAVGADAGPDAPPAFEEGWVVGDQAGVSPGPTNLTSSAGCTWTSDAGADENLPINCVSWQEAYAFCIWDGGFLPSQAELEYAAAGGNQQRQCPWGECGLGNMNSQQFNDTYAIVGCEYPPGSGSGTGSCDGGGASNIAPVGTASLGAGRWRQLDLGGEVYEWTLDSLDSTASPNAYYVPCTNCVYSNSSSEHLILGGDYMKDYTSIEPPNSDSLSYVNTVSRRSSTTGFRCARAP